MEEIDDCFLFSFINELSLNLITPFYKRLFIKTIFCCCEQAVHKNKKNTGLDMFIVRWVGDREINRISEQVH